MDACNINIFSLLLTSPYKDNFIDSANIFCIEVFTIDQTIGVDEICLALKLNFSALTLVKCKTSSNVVLVEKPSNRQTPTP